LQEPVLSVRVGVGWSPLDREATGTARFLEVAETLEELAYDSIWLSDTATRPGAAPLPLLAAVAARTERLKLGTSVLVVPPRQPVLLAKELATIDAISDGRLLPAFGLGIDDPAEVAALGVAREERTARLEETVAVIRELWRGGPVSYRGRFTALDGAVLSPRPARDRLEIWLSGSSPAALRRVGRIGDGWLASRVSVEEFARGVESIRAAAAESGRAVPEDHYGMIVFAAASAADARPLEELSRARPSLDFRSSVGVGADGVHALLSRYREAGATKFVLIPLAPDPVALLRELKPAVVDPFETP